MTVKGTAIRYRIPRAGRELLHAEVTIKEQEGRYTLDLTDRSPQRHEEPAPIVGELRKFLEDRVKKLNRE